MTGHEDDVLDRTPDRRLIRRLLGYLRPYKGQVVLAGVVVVADVLVQLAGPYLTMEAIDNGIRHRDESHLEYVAFLYLCVLLAGFLLGYLQTRIMHGVGQRVMLDLRLQLFRHLQRLPVSFFDRQPAGRVLTRVTHDVDVLNELLTAGVLAMVANVLTMLGILIAMIRLNAELLGVAFSVLPLIVVVTLVFRSRMRRTFREIRARVAQMNASLGENLAGMSTVQMLNHEEKSLEDFRRLNAAHRDAQLRAVYHNALLFPALELVGALAVGLIVWYGGRQVMWTGITLGTLVAFLQFTQRFFRPVADLGDKYQMLQQAMASSERVFDLLDTPVAETQVSVAEPQVSPVPTAALLHPERLQGRIEFENVWFAYRDSNWVLRDVSLTIEAGEKVAVVGATGSGKSTLTSLLMGFYVPQRGVVRVDGRPLSDYALPALRRRMGLVLQDSLLFSGTVSSNLKLAPGAVSDQELQRIARDLGADDFIRQLPGEYQAEVRERGTTLSSGQRQLLALCRALAHDPDVVVLDEATSSVDAGTERRILDALQGLLARRTALIVAHRLSTLQDVERIVVLHHGQVREIGRHEELMARRGIYYRLYQLQSLRVAGARREAREILRGIEADDLPIVDSRVDLA